MIDCVFTSVSLLIASIFLGFAFTVRYYLFPYVDVPLAVRYSTFSSGDAVDVVTVRFAATCQSCDSVMLRIDEWNLNKRIKMIENGDEEGYRHGVVDLNPVACGRRVAFKASAVNNAEQLDNVNGQIRTPPCHNRQAHSYRFGFGSCMLWIRDQRLESFFDWLNKQNLDSLILLGDTVYTDAAPAAERRYAGRAYRRLLSLPSFAQLLRHVPLFVMLDDHEIADDYHQGPDTALYHKQVFAIPILRSSSHHSTGSALEKLHCSTESALY